MYFENFKLTGGYIFTPQFALSVLKIDPYFSFPRVAEKPHTSYGKFSVYLRLSENHITTECTKDDYDRFCKWVFETQRDYYKKVAPYEWDDFQVHMEATSNNLFGEMTRGTPLEDKAKAMDRYEGIYWKERP
jgi:hypothetical protein